MSSIDLAHNLSFSINLPKTTVHSEDVMIAVNETLKKFYFETQFQDYLYFLSINKCESEGNEFSAVKQSDKTILCEVNAGLWNKALTSAIYSLTQHTSPDYVVVQQFINYLLNKESFTDFGLLEEFFCKLILSHPPNSENFKYYWKILHEHFVTLDGKKPEEQGLFLCLIEVLTSCLKNKDHFNNSKYLFPNEGNVFYESQQNLEIREDICNNYLCSQTNKKDTSYFEELPWREKIKRCLTALNFVYNILETDFAFHLHSRGSKLPVFEKNNRPLISHLLWPEIREVGFMNKEAHQVLNLYKLVHESGDRDLPQIYVVYKIVTLLAEVIRCSDSGEENKYPFLGVKSNNFARELSTGLHQSIVKLLDKNEFSKSDDVILNLKPPWLRLLLSSHLLSYFTGYQCVPDLTGAYDILEHIAEDELKANKREKTKKAQKSKSSVNLEIVRRLKKLKSINAKLSNGKTLLHLACEGDNVEEVKALLVFPELDVNALDLHGWTPLHIASYKGNISCIRELLQFRPKSGDLQKSVNTRARGPESITPLMCAVSEGHAEVCRLLLEHTGSVLLEDINECSQTPMELSRKVEVTRILKHYKDNILWTMNGRKDINLDAKYKEIVLKLCVEMIQSYFCTYKTWDVYRYLKRREKNISQPNSCYSEVEFEWDYVRYHRDIKRNIYKLRRLIPKLSNVSEFKDSHEIFTRILSFNKSC